MYYTLYHEAQNMAQVISTIQRKGGACKSTMIQCIAAYMASDDAKVLIIDTDPQASCIEWSEEQNIESVDTLAHLDEDTILDVIERLQQDYDAILIDTAGFDSRMASYAIQASDLVLIPSGGSKTNVMGAARTWKHATVTTRLHINPPVIRIAFWGVKKNSNVYRHAEETITQAGIPFIGFHVGNLTGFEAMSWNGGLPTGTARTALSAFMESMKDDNLIVYYATGAERGKKT